VKIECTNLEKDLGIMIDSGLTFVEHMHMVSKKANGIMAVIRRTFTCLDIKCFNLLCKALVRSHLEYGVTTWFPYKVKDIEIIESVQKRGLLDVSFPRRFVPWNETSIYGRNETSIYGRFVLRTFRSLDVSFSRRFVPWTIHTLYDSFWTPV